MDTLTQEDLNTEMTTIGVGRYRNKVESAKARGTESETTYGQRLIRGALPKYIKAIDDLKGSWKKVKNKGAWQVDLLEVPSEKIGFLVMRTALDLLTRKTKMVSLCTKVGNVLDYQIRCDRLIKANKKGEGIVLGATRKRGWVASKHHIRVSIKHEVEKGLMEDIETWSRRDITSAGVNLVELLRDATGIIEYLYITDTGRRTPTRYVTASEETLRWVEDFNYHKEMLSPFWLPTVDTPLEWKNIWEGGYRVEFTELPKMPFIKTTNMEFLRGVEGKLEEPMEACNLIQQTPWKVNTDVLQTMQWAWENSVKIGGLPSREDEVMPDVPSDFHENKKSKAVWKRMAAGVHKRNASTRSRRLLVSKVLFLAEKMSNSRFFYPSHCDFRGRVYNIPAFLGVQGPDMCRGLLKFARPQRIKSDTDYKWLAIQGANTWGYDKVTLDERVKWSNDFATDAKRIAANPTKELLWTEADDPWQFLAWCFEWAQLQNTGKLDTLLPVNMDATNNGLQILSMLTRDEYGMAATNVSPTDAPADIYLVVAKQAERILREQAAEGDAIAKTWLDFGINRKTTKRSVMCYSYGLTEYSNRAYIDDWYDDQIHGEGRTKAFDEDDKYVAIHVLAKAVWKGIESVLDKPKQCMDWFQECASILSKADMPLNWVTPSGFPVHQEYFNYHYKQVKTWISGAATHVRYREEDDKLSKRRQKNGVSPNFVHSLDAAALHKTVIRANKEANIYDFAFIHDSYGTHATGCEALSKILRSVFVDMFSDDLLQDWRNQLSNQSGLELPAPPDYGNADISKISESTYFFS
jgi:DNA-directed RNA polymerase, mitochondrial